MLKGLKYFATDKDENRFTELSHTSAGTGFSDYDSSYFTWVVWQMTTDGVVVFKLYFAGSFSGD